MNQTLKILPDKTRVKIQFTEAYCKEWGSGSSVDGCTGVIEWHHPEFPEGPVYQVWLDKSFTSEHGELDSFHFPIDCVVELEPLEDDDDGGISIFG